jgi:hypothetical protein
MKKKNVPELVTATLQRALTHIGISFVPVRVISDVASLGTLANCIDTTKPVP